MISTSTERMILGQVLKRMGLLSEADIQEALSIQREKADLIGAILAEMGLVQQDNILGALGVQAGMEVVSLDGAEIDASVIAKVPASLTTVYNVIPIKFENDTLTVAVSVGSVVIVE